MNRLLKSAALAVGLSFAATAALACGADGCGKDKDGKMECCCDKMKDKAATPAKPDAKKPAQAEPEHQH
jgi:hypothetical protein